MLLTPHTIVGVAIASAVHNPFVAVPISVAFHFLGDKMPHWDFYTFTKREDRLKGWIPLAVMTDLVFGVAVGMFFTLYALWQKNNNLLALNIFLCGVGSVIPDVLTGPSLYLEKSPKIFHIIHKLQSKMQTPVGPFWGIVSQLTVVVLSFFVIVYSLSK